MSSTNPSTNVYDFAVDPSLSFPPTCDEANANLSDDMNEEWKGKNNIRFNSSNETNNDNFIINQKPSPTTTPTHEDKWLKITTGPRKTGFTGLN